MLVPRLRALGASSPRLVALLLHGGRENGPGPVPPWALTYLRMVPFAYDLARASREIGVFLLRYRVRGWNAPGMDPVRDARWALAEVRRRHPGVPVVLVGHSMGGRVALRVADDPAVTAVCALAPWCTPEDPWEQLAGRDVLIAHGELDQVTSPAASRAYARQATGVARAVTWQPVPRETHAMLRRPSRWHDLVRRFTLGQLVLSR